VLGVQFVYRNRPLQFGQQNGAELARTPDWEKKSAFRRKLILQNNLRSQPRAPCLRILPFFQILWIFRGLSVFGASKQGASEAGRDKMGKNHSPGGDPT
jgi:hypothetical protein